MQRAIFFCRMKICSRDRIQDVVHSCAHARKNDIPSTWYPPCLSLLPLLLLLFTKIHQPLPLNAMFVVYVPLYLYVLHSLCVSK